MGVKTFFTKNVVVLVMVPVIIGAHYGWYKLQEIESLVTPAERNKLPIAKLVQNISLSSKD